MFGMLNIWVVECWGCEILVMWDAVSGDFQNVEYWGYGIFGMWDI